LKVASPARASRRSIWPASNDNPVYELVPKWKHASLSPARNAWQWDSS
jgi:hypothetical protein